MKIQTVKFKALKSFKLLLKPSGQASRQSSLQFFYRSPFVLQLHHKFTETDADPHNSRRGMFFAHVGWLLTKKVGDLREESSGKACKTCDARKLTNIRDDWRALTAKSFYQMRSNLTLDDQLLKIGCYSSYCRTFANQNDLWNDFIFFYFFFSIRTSKSRVARWTWATSKPIRSFSSSENSTYLCIYF